MQPVETRYRGYRFRSRLEARWAVFFDALGIKWEYEAEGFDLGALGWYLPDFWLVDMKMWVEVKPEAASPLEKEKVYKLSALRQEFVLLIEGYPGYDEKYGVYIYSHKMTLFGGEAYDIFDAPCFDREQFGGYNTLLFENLRDKLLNNHQGFLSPGDWESKTCHALDERTRRKYIIELDKMYYSRKYNKEHPTWIMGRHGKEIFFWKDISGQWILYSNEDPRCDPLEEVLDAYDAARAARFEHGE